MRLLYANARREESERLVEPWGLVDKDEVWYLVAGTDRGRRTFRLDRVVSAEPMDQRFERPGDFELEEAWAEVVGEVEQRRSQTWATVLIETRFVPILRDHFGRHCQVDEDLDDGRSRVRVGAHARSTSPEPSPAGVATSRCWSRPASASTWAGSGRIWRPATREGPLPME